MYQFTLTQEVPDAVSHYISLKVLISWRDLSPPYETFLMLFSYQPNKLFWKHCLYYHWIFLYEGCLKLKIKQLRGWAIYTKHEETRFFFFFFKHDEKVNIGFSNNIFLFFNIFQVHSPLLLFPQLHDLPVSDTFVVQTIIIRIEKILYWKLPYFHCPHRQNFFWICIINISSAILYAWCFCLIYFSVFFMNILFNKHIS